MENVKNPPAQSVPQVRMILNLHHITHHIDRRGSQSKHSRVSKRTPDGWLFQSPHPRTVCD